MALVHAVTVMFKTSVVANARRILASLNSPSTCAASCSWLGYAEEVCHTEQANKDDGRVPLPFFLVNRAMMLCMATDQVGDHCKIRVATPPEAHVD
jgi:hypothetical protein